LPIIWRIFFHRVDAAATIDVIKSSQDASEKLRQLGYSHIDEFGPVVQVDMSCPIYNKQFFGLSQTPG
jgi:hypothetical protein